MLCSTALLIPGPVWPVHNPDFNTPTRSRCGRNQSNTSPKTLHDGDGNVLGQGIIKLVLGSDVEYFHTTELNLLANVVVLNLYVLRSTVNNWIDGQEDRFLVVQTQGSRSSHVVTKF